MIDEDYDYNVRFHDRAYTRYDESTKKGRPKSSYFFCIALTSLKALFSDRGLHIVHDVPIKTLLNTLALNGATAPHTPITALFTTCQPQLFAYLLWLERTFHILLVAEYQ
jgi:hypothetical protein